MSYDRYHETRNTIKPHEGSRGKRFIGEEISFINYDSHGKKYGLKDGGD